MLACGRLAARFEERLCQRVGALAGVAASSGAAALELALAALGVGPGHEVVVPSYVCRSVPEAVLGVGAVPVLADSGPDWAVSPQAVDRVKTSRTRAVVVAHLYGVFADVEAFKPLGLPIVEDCAQALAGPPDASCRTGAGASGFAGPGIKGDVAVFSFHPTKCLTTGEGGFAATLDGEIAGKLLSAHAGERGELAVRLTARMSDLQAALGLSQLARYDQFLWRRAAIAAKYAAALGDKARGLLNARAFARSMHFRFVLRAPGGLQAHGEHFLKRGIAVRRGVDELLHRVMGLPDESFPEATSHFNTTISTPIHPAMSEEEVDRCAEALASLRV
jgi:dTDP-4-amino-4,6-dideoxygalactose transaminase